MAAKSEYEKLSDSALEKEMQRLQAERSAIGEEQEKLAAIRDKRAQEARATSLLEGLSPGERDVLIKAATAQAKSEAKNPGGSS